MSVLRIGEVTCVAFIRIMKQAGIDPFKVEKYANRLSDTAILKQGFSRVEEETLRAGGNAVGDLFLVYSTFI